MPFTIAEIAKIVGGEAVGDTKAVLENFTTIERAQPGDLTFAENDDFFARAEQSAATAIIAEKRFSSSKKTVIQVPNARIAFAKALAAFFPDPKFPVGIHPTAVVAKTALIDSSAYLGPHCVVGERVKIGARSVLQAGNFVGDDSVLGEDVHLFPNVTVYPRGQIGNRVRIHANSVVGSDGYGYVLDNGVHRKVPQIGNVVIGDDVEIGAGVTIDRGALGSTVIGKGTKIDNLVQVGHGSKVGEDTLLCAQAGLAGSTDVGKNVILAGQVGVAGHCKIGDGAIATAQSGIPNDVPAGAVVSGYPAIDNKLWLRCVAVFNRLPELARKLKRDEK